MKRNVECLLTLNRMQEQTTTSLNLLETNNIGTYTYSPYSLLKLEKGFQDNPSEPYHTQAYGLYVCDAGRDRTHSFNHTIRQHQQDCIG